MSQYDAIESKRWKRDDGRTASLYGSTPWVSAAERDRWHVESRGWTIRDNRTGTISTGRAPFATLADCEAYIRRLET